MRKLSVVGSNERRIEALEKAAGKAKFCGDLALPGMLHTGFCKSPYPHANILAVDASKAKGIAGVLKGP